MERQGGLIAFAPSNAKHACIATTDALQMSQSPTGAITGMANGHDNLLDLPPRAPEVSEAVAPRGFDIFLQQHYKGLVQFLRQRTVTETDRTSVGSGKSGSGRVDLGGRRYSKKKKIENQTHTVTDTI